MTGAFPAPAAGQTGHGGGRRQPAAARPAPRIRHRRAAVLAAVLVTALGVAVWGQLAPKGDGVRLSVNNPGPDGARAVAQILGGHGVTVHNAGTFEAASGALRGNASPTLLLFDPDGYLADERLLELASLAAEVVVVSPRLQTLAALGSGIRQAGVVPDASPTVEPGCSLQDAEAAGTVTGEGGLVYDGGTSCYRPDGSSPAGMLAVSADGRLTVLGSTAVLANERLADLGNAALSLRLLGNSPDLVWYLPSVADLDVAGDGQSLDDLAPGWARFLGPWLVLVAVTAMAWRGRRLGPLVFEPLPAVVRAVETEEGRARLYHDSHAVEHARENLRAGTLVRLAAGLRLGSGATADQVIDATAQFLGRPASGLRELINGLPRTEARLVAWAQEMDRLEKEVRNK